LGELRRAAREIFDAGLRSADARGAVRRAVKLKGVARLEIFDTSLDLAARPSPVYAVALGKAARTMASALDEILREQLGAGVLSGPQTESLNAVSRRPHGHELSDRWNAFEGGHPLPNEGSLNAARAAFALLRRVEDERAAVIFLVSGGGSAMMEWPREDGTTLTELREANRALVSCGASISEINSVRRAFSAVKGGGLALHAPRADQISLIISDTCAGDEASVASGPTFPPPPHSPDAREVVARYDLEAVLPASIIRAINLPTEAQAEYGVEALRRHYVLLDNNHAVEAAAGAARSKGYVVEVAHDLVEQHVAEGCALLLERLYGLRGRAGGRVACLISGGEFACPVRGKGTGGRNSETALRCAVELVQHQKMGGAPWHVVALSAGTDGIDGNSPAAGALADETTLSRARALGMSAQELLEASDAYTFFHALGDDVVTGPTGTNVRDLRILLAV
jgi:hydroxypyruvate reductase